MTGEPPSRPVRSSVAVVWGGRFVLLAILLGAGLLLAWRPLRPGFVPGWLWWFLTGGYGQAFFATALVLVAMSFARVQERLAAGGARVLAALLLVAIMASLAGAAVLLYQRELPVVAVVAAVLALALPFGPRLLPSLPRAQARLRP